VDVGAGTVTVWVSVSVTVWAGVVTVLAAAATVNVLVTVVEDRAGRSASSRLAGRRSWADVCTGSVMTWSTLWGWLALASTPTNIPISKQVIAPATRAAT
jgi:hypothetical protein